MSNEREATLRYEVVECHAALSDLLVERPELTSLVCGSTTLGNRLIRCSAVIEGATYDDDDVAVESEVHERFDYAHTIRCGSCDGHGTFGEHGCTDCLGTGLSPSAMAGGVEQALNDAYAEGRKDESEEHAWRPIETAPKDGSEILGYARGDIRVCSWEPLNNPVAKQWGIDGTWHRRNIKSGKSLLGVDFVPTHWMPLPKHPGA